MDYMDVKALSELLDGYQAFFAELRQVQQSLQEAGVDTTPLRRALPLRELVESYQTTQHRYNAAFLAYLGAHPDPWPGKQGEYAGRATL